MLNETVSLYHAHPLDLVIMAVSPNSKHFPYSLQNWMLISLSSVQTYVISLWAFLSSLMETPIGDSFLGLYQVSVAEERIFLSTVWIGSPARPSHTTQLYLSIVYFPIETIQNLYLKSCFRTSKDYPTQRERDTVPTPLPSKLLWLKMTFLDQNISKSNSETAILLLMEKVETL